MRNSKSPANVLVDIFGNLSRYVSVLSVEVFCGMLELLQHSVMSRFQSRTFVFEIVSKVWRVAPMVLVSKRHLSVP